VLNGGSSRACQKASGLRLDECLVDVEYRVALTPCNLYDLLFLCDPAACTSGVAFTIMSIIHSNPKAAAFSVCFVLNPNCPANCVASLLASELLVLSSNQREGANLPIKRTDSHIKGGLLELSAFGNNI
jgi:hypothetical protein